MILRSAIDLVAFKQCQMLCRAFLASAKKENQPVQRDSWSWERGKEKKKEMKIERTTMLMSEREMKLAIPKTWMEALELPPRQHQA